RRGRRYDCSLISSVQPCVIAGCGVGIGNLSMKRENYKCLFLTEESRYACSDSLNNPVVRARGKNQVSVTPALVKFQDEDPIQLGNKFSFQPMQTQRGLQAVNCTRIPE